MKDRIHNKSFLFVSLLSQLFVSAMQSWFSKPPHWGSSHLLFTLITHIYHKHLLVFIDNAQHGTMLLSALGVCSIYSVFFPKMFFWSALLSPFKMPLQRGCFDLLKFHPYSRAHFLYSSLASVVPHTALICKLLILILSVLPQIKWMLPRERERDLYFVHYYIVAHMTVRGLTIDALC